MTTETATITVTPEQILEEWITGLESGEYPQITGRLIDSIFDPDVADPPTGYCCLGVLCLVAESHGLLVRTGGGGDHWETAAILGPGTETSTGDDGTDTELPVILAEWLGIEPNPTLDGTPAIDRNDNEHQSFAVIASAARTEFNARLVQA